MSSPQQNKRREMDVMKLLMSDWKVELVNESTKEFEVEFQGPPGNLVNVFEVFLPQLLLYPNPSDPLNGEAAALMNREPEAYKSKIKDYVQRYARNGATSEYVPQARRQALSAAHEPPATTAATAPAASETAVLSESGDKQGAKNQTRDNHGDEEELLGLLSDSEDEL